ncbi:putative 3-oxoacyl-(acyl-carrier-protein) reductase FabG [Candidatus Terasakiella magnetica]|uniref:Putative 3-oxoacyl-(Acyl-carrier-protein) reductase FabG n=1 Tax=Candidatus Terasakiella magnetica TaxID=1867952 RepID=A0A1C3RKR5_9PROT|nr:SDR family oxidoreductase [Candidatus Terasakiella magnetica]SCA57846.1 putative 3-oxoacyl-(acyl-carrier-protein) reductase FabG [Candidatus Terasakiella magnetica]
MDLGLKGKKALITGGSHGIGLATALRLASEGCDVAICSRTQERLDEASALLKPRGTKVLAFRCDVLENDEIDEGIALIKKEWGSLDIIVNNVGGGGRWGKPNIVESPDIVWYEVMQKNAMAAARFTRAFLDDMKAQKWGRVVTVSSIVGKEGGGRPWFNMAKAAEISFSKTMALMPEYGQAGITFNTVCPGAIMIPGTGWEDEQKKDPEAFAKMTAEKNPMGRLGKPEEAGDVIAFVCSERASYMSGALITVDGCETKSF